MSEPVDIPATHHRENGEQHGSAECYPRAVWLDLCAGRDSGLHTLQLLEHAAQCLKCGAILHEASKLLADEATQKEEAQLAAFKLSSAGGQRRLAETLRRKVERDRSAKRGRWRWFQGWWPAIAVAATVLVVGCLLGYRLLFPTDARLLAEAYSNHRVSDLRIPGSLAVALASPTRGRATEGASSELLRVKLHTQQAFEKNPNDAGVRQTLGRIAIVEHDGETALRQFEMARTLDRNLPDIQFDLGTAYFELAESSPDKALNDARAIDFFGQYLQSTHERDSVALFDRALCWERDNVDPEAVKDFEAAKALEKDPGWRSEIDRHLKKLKDRDARGNSKSNPANLTPSAFLAHHGDSPGEYELYLDASRDWLPLRVQNAEADKALHQLAAMGVRHGDAWLEDLLQRAPTPGEVSAEQALSRALHASGKVKADEALAASEAAIKLFEADGNQPGLVRARLEHVYNLQLMGQGDECLAEARPLLKDARLARYSWQLGYLELEVAACSVTVGKIDDGLKMSMQAGALAHSHGLTREGLRASGFIADEEFLEGHLIEAWTTASSALLESYAVPESKNRQHQLFFDLEAIVRTLNLHWTQVGLADADLQAAIGGENLRTPAFAAEALGLAQMQVDRDADAGHSFMDADAKLSKLDHGAATARYLAEWKPDRALLHARQSGLPVALKELSDQESVYEAPGVPLPRVHYFATYAELLREFHQPQESIQKALHAVEAAGHMLPAAHSEQEQRTWVDIASPAYEVLTLSLIESGHAESALGTWETFRAAPYGSAKRHDDKMSVAEFTKRLPVIPKPAEGTLTIVFARLRGQYVVWSLSDSSRESLRLRILPTRAAEIEGQASAFEHLCEDPQSSQQDLKLLGDTLYTELMSPFEDQMERAQSIQFDLDPSLSRIPFAALGHQNRLLGLDHPLLFLPPWWMSGGTHNDPLAATANDRLPEHARLLVLRESSSAPSAHIPEQYDESGDIIARFPRAQSLPVSLHRSGPGLMMLGDTSLKEMLAQADLIHYSGHGLGEAPVQNTADSHGKIRIPIAGGSLKRCSVAVLAACRTRGKREDALDDDLTFERIMLASGAKEVLGAQWDVDSAMTRKLMVRFYAELADRQTFMESLRRAQKELQAQPESSHPYFWSAFQLVGQ